jgi:hypothetical protein
VAGPRVRRAGERGRACGSLTSTTEILAEPDSEKAAVSESVATCMSSASAAIFMILERLRSAADATRLNAEGPKKPPSPNTSDRD